MYIAKKRSLVPWVMLVLLLVIVGVSYLLSDILTPFLVGIVLAYFLNPLAERLEKYMPRFLVSFILVMFTVVVVVLFIAVIVPVIIDQARELVEKIPWLLEWLAQKRAGFHLPHALEKQLSIRSALNLHSLSNIWQQNSETFKSVLASLTHYIKRTGTGLLWVIYDILMLPVTTLYFLHVWPRLVRRINSLIPLRYVPAAHALAREVEETLNGFVRGQLLVLMVMGLVYGTGLMLVGLRNGFILGFVMGFLGIIPYVGFIVGSILSSLSAILQFGDFGHLIAVWVVFSIGQVLESLIVAPKLIGDRIGLSPVLVILSLFAFGQIFGFLGVLLALPLAGVCAVIGKTLYCAYHQSKFYLEE